MTHNYRSSVAIWLVLFGLLAQNVYAQEGVVQSVYFTAGIESDGITTHVYVEDNGKKEFVTEGAQNNSHVHARGEYVVWSTAINGAGQIFRYHVPTGITTQLTFTGTNLNPSVDAVGRVVWEGWNDEKWNIYYFDGLTKRRVTTQFVAVSPDIDGDTIVYSEKNNETSWRTVLLNIHTNTAKVIATDAEKKEVYFVDGAVVYGNTKKVADVPTVTKSEAKTADASINVTKEQIEEELKQVSYVEQPQVTESAQPTSIPTPTVVPTILIQPTTEPTIQPTPTSIVEEQQVPESSPMPVVSGTPEEL